ncbi:MAG TPA: acyl-CoA dehydrogenase family protein [Candidatus Acidoferrum sp.]|nr:acyl-CoA dehydrogenase family protein [Candidatus Acidoferrum sp.]
MSQSEETRSREVAEAAREADWRHESFAKELFLGRLALNLIDSAPEPGREERERGDAFLHRLETFLREEVDPLQIERDAKIPERVIRGLAELGAFGMNIPQEYGGLGLSQVYYNRALQRAASAHSALGALLSAHQSIGVPKPLLLFGTEEQKRKFLPRVAKGAISAFLLTEPDVGSDPARMQATATPTEDGAAYILDGTKLWTTNGVIADLLVVMANVPPSDGHRGGITAFIVEASSPGLRVLRRNAFMGIRGIENAVTGFEHVRVPAENRIGEEGRGLKIALVTLNTGRLSLPATCAASSKACLTIVREWANARVQWGKPIGKHEAVAQKIAFIAGTSFAMESMVELAGALADAKRTDIRIEAAMAKLWCSEMAWRVADEMVQIRGGRGFETAESLRARGERPVPAEQILRDLRIARIFEGSSEIMRLFIAREAVDHHVKLAAGFMKPNGKRDEKMQALKGMTRFYARWLPGLTVGPGRVPLSYRGYGQLGDQVRFIERSARRLARSIFYGMARWQARLERQQAFLGRLVDIGTELFAMSAVCVRAQMLSSTDATRGKQAIELADLFCHQSRRRVKQLFHELWSNDDAYNYKAAQRVLSGIYAWTEEGVLDLYGSGPLTAVPESERRAAAS